MTCDLHHIRLDSFELHKAACHLIGRVAADSREGHHMHALAPTHTGSAVLSLPSALSEATTVALSNVGVMVVSLLLVVATGWVGWLMLHENNRHDEELDEIAEKAAHKAHLADVGEAPGGLPGIPPYVAVVTRKLPAIKTTNHEPHPAVQSKA